MTQVDSPRYQIASDGAFVVRDYHRARPFSSFLPGVAGLWGIPLWCYYVNRGQVVACFGTQNKDHAIMQFESANLHHRRIGTEGFRTLIRVRRGDGDPRFYEPFQPHSAHHQTSNVLTIRPGSLHLEETNNTLGLRVNVDYFTIPNEPFAALARKLTVTDISGHGGQFEIIDGAAKVVPYGEAAMFLQVMPFITEAYLQIDNLAGRVPLMFMKAKPSDISETEFVSGGNFFFGFDEADGTLLPPIVDPELVFGDMVDLARPHRWLYDGRIDPAAFQAQHCTTPCALLHWQFDLAPGASRTLRSLFGYARSLEQAKALPETVAAPGWLDAKAQESDAELEKIRHHFFLHCGSDVLNHYVPNTFLDNVLRGGLPLTLPAKHRKHVFHVFSRRHGDLERDYNFFSLEPTCFSQGNGAFRDVNQNRRCDVWFNPDVGPDNVRFFFNLVQPDGYNPLLVKGALFRVDGKLPAGVLRQLKPAAKRKAVAQFLSQPFSPGRLFEFLDSHSIALSVPRAAFLEQVLAHCQKVEEAEYESGYWTDHWYYNFDLLESFVAIFPEQARELLVERNDFTYWDPYVRVLPRNRKYVLRPDGQVRHLSSLEEDKAYHRLIESRASHKHGVRGARGIHTTTLLAKIVCLLTNKAATLAPSGMGVDTDGGRPGWLDSINGIPSLFASSTPECYQLLRAIRMVRDLLADLPDNHVVRLPAFVHEFARHVRRACDAYLASKDRARDYAYWDATNTAKEKYRQQVYAKSFACREVPMRWSDIRAYFAAIEKRVAASLKKAIDKSSALPLTYIMHEAVDYAVLRGKTNSRGMPCVDVRKFKPHPFPVFLEAPTHAMATETDRGRAKGLWQTVRVSPLYDRKLGMYITTDAVSAESKELGRIWAWPPGWFENENVFLHMEHKYLLATLKAGLFDEFFIDMKRCLIPFQPIEVYGRSPLENASFIVSSRHPRPDHHGRGYLPRSSGTTAEVLQMFL